MKFVNFCMKIKTALLRFSRDRGRRSEESAYVLDLKINEIGN